jgi:hypothetical protein
VAELFFLKTKKIANIEYEQIIADRYLFSPFANESS